MTVHPNRYQIVEANTSAILAREVEEFMTKGWQAAGAAFVYQDTFGKQHFKDKNVFCQTMVKGDNV